jgi:hypothetical protein
MSLAVRVAVFVVLTGLSAVLLALPYLPTQ